MKYLFGLLSLPLVIFLCIARLLEGFYGASQWASLIPGELGNHTRRIFYKIFLKKCGKNLYVAIGTLFTRPDISIGNNVRFGPYNTVGLVDFGDDVTIAQNVHFLSGSHQHGTKDITIPMNRQQGELRRISLGSDIWVGAGAIIMADVANGSVIASGAVVSSDIKEAAMIWGGIPAKVLATRG